MPDTESFIMRRTVANRHTHNAKPFGTDVRREFPFNIAGARTRRLFDIVCVIAATAIAMLVLGYHPYAEDGGIYTAAIEARLNPTLFPHDRLWVSAHTRFALFVPIVAGASQTLRLSLPTTLLIFYIAGIVGLLAAVGHLARTCFPGQRPWLAVLTIGVAAGLPVAGTALYAVDPYCTARTLTTPLLLMALSFALRRRWPVAAACWAAAASMHPLMALWGVLPILVVAALATRHPYRWTIALAAVTLVAASLIQSASPLESVDTYAIAHTRGYWFPAQWRWFEWLGAAAPCILLAGADRLSRPGSRSRFHALSIATIVTTLLATLLALCFAHEFATSLIIARLQPMRSLHLVFVAFLAAGGAFVQRHLRTVPQAAAVGAALILAAGSLMAMQRSLFPKTAHFEWPGAPPTNPWEAAFAWCRSNTPTTAQFALDADYIDLPGEDSQGFRAIALRSVLPDRIKDAGIAAVLPSLTSPWTIATTATRGLNQLTDSQRSDRLLPLGVTWLVLPVTAATAQPCPYQNVAAKVCLLQAAPAAP